jgi:hypothetical protein
MACEAYRRGTTTETGCELSQETVAAVDQYEPEYLQLIHSDMRRSVVGRGQAIVESERVEHLSDQGIHLEYIADGWAGWRR